MSLDSRARAKDPVLSARGTRGALVRWGREPRIVKIGDLTDPQRRLVLALVAAAKAVLVASPPDADA